MKGAWISVEMVKRERSGLRGILEVSLTVLGYRLILGTEGKNRKKRKVGTKADISDSSNSSDTSLR